MKKVLESELLSLAHRILQMKSKEVDDLYQVSKELYEKLLILKFYEDRVALNLIQDVSEEELKSALEKTIENKSKTIDIVEERLQMPVDLAEEDYPLVVDATKEVFVEQHISVLDHVEKIETPIEEDTLVQQQVAYNTAFDESVFEENTIGDQELIDLLDEHEVVLQQPTAFTSTEVDEVVQVVDVWNEEAQVVAEANISTVVDDNLIVEVNESVVATSSFEVDAIEENKNDPFFGFDYKEVEFVKVNEVPSEIAVDVIGNFVAMEEEKVEKTEGSAQNTLFNMDTIPVKEVAPVKAKSLNDVYNSTIVVGLNDRIAFEKYLFEGSSEDFNRVLSQLNTVGSYEEAISFVEHLVKPEYNNWDGKNEYEERFMTIVEKRFA